jgi:hypothetical protein
MYALLRQGVPLQRFTEMPVLQDDHDWSPTADDTRQSHQTVRSTTNRAK